MVKEKQVSTNNPIVDEHYPKKPSVPQEQTESTFKCGELMPIVHVDGFYRVEGLTGVFTSRAYAEEAYRKMLTAKTMVKFNKDIKDAKKRVHYGLEKESAIDKVEEKKQEWLEKH